MTKYKKLNRFMLMFALTGVVGCVQSQVPITNYSSSTCQGYPYTDDNFTNLTQAGTYCDTLRTVDGCCDSIVCLTLTVYPNDTGYYSAAVCYGQSYSDICFTNLTQAGTYRCILQTIYGCDSVVYLTLTIYPFVYPTNYSASICSGETYTDNNFQNLTQAGNHYVTWRNRNGCDSLVCLTLTVHPYVPITNYSATFCQGGSYTDANFSNLAQAGTYYNTLRNVNNCDSVVCLTLSYPISPVQQLCRISVDENNHNEIVWKSLQEVVSYKIYRESNQIGLYDLVANIAYNQPNMWVDMSSNARTRSYNYKISAIDTCGKESALSDAHKTMHLTINAGQNNSWNLIWTAYEGTAYSTYNIYRATEDTLNSFTLIGTMPAGNTSFSDFTAPAGYVYYVVEIILNEPCVLTKSLSSIRSNIASNNPNVGIAEAPLMASLQVYPNPAKGQLKIKNEELREGDVIEIYNVVGQNVGAYPCGRPEMTIDISHLANGMYFLQIGGKTMRFVKE